MIGEGARVLMCPRVVDAFVGPYALVEVSRGRESARVDDSRELTDDNPADDDGTVSGVPAVCPLVMLAESGLRPVLTDRLSKQDGVRVLRGRSPP